MPSPRHEAYRNSVLKWFRTHANDPDVPQALKLYGDAALVLWHLDLEPARPTLRHCYAVDPRGGKPRDPIIMLRCFLLAALVGEPSITKWVKLLKSSRVLRVLAGLDPEEDEGPGVGTYYDFCNRLHDGPKRHDCEHAQRPSRAQRRRAKSPRKPKRKPKPEEKNLTKAERKARRKRIREKDPVTASCQNPGVTQRLIDQLKHSEQSRRPGDLLCRLCDILIDVAVVESAHRGLLGDLRHLTLTGDGSPLYTGANGNGRRTCEHQPHEKCDCPRIYSDPDAAWGWDSYRECYFFGHHSYAYGVSGLGHDLPLALYLGQGSETDHTASLHCLDSLRKALREHGLDWHIDRIAQDSGHDAECYFRYLGELGIQAAIPLQKPAPAVHPLRPDVQLSPRGVPLCPAGAEMASWGSAGGDRKVFICPAKAGAIDSCPNAPDGDPQWRCRPELRWGPTLSLPVSLNPRLCPSIPRNSATYRILMNLRSGSERNNSAQKYAFKLEEARHRRASFWLIRLHLIAILQHAKAWVAEEDASALVKHLLGREELKKAG